jgi:hypothetical protein
MVASSLATVVLWNNHAATVWIEQAVAGLISESALDRSNCTSRFSSPQQEP